MRLTIATVYHPLPLHPPADIIKNFDAKNWRPIIRATQLAFGMPKSRHQVSAQPVQIARMKYSFETVPLPSPANHDGNERGEERGEERCRSKGNVYLPIYLSIEETEGGLGRTNGSDGKRERKEGGKRRKMEKGVQARRV